MEKTKNDQIVPHGKWVMGKKYKVYHCSNCMEEAYWDTDYSQQLFRYCPYCGACMDEQSVMAMK